MQGKLKDKGGQKLSEDYIELDRTFHELSLKREESEEYDFRNFFLEKAKLGGSTFWISNSYLV